MLHKLSKAHDLLWDDLYVKAYARIRWEYSISILMRKLLVESGLVEKWIIEFCFF
jgi:hypothetical protein